MNQPTGLLICGGTSRRMGTDKASLSWNGMSLLEHGIRCLQQLTEQQLILSANAQHSMPGIVRIADHWPDAGPLSALVSGLRASPSEWTLVLAVDMPGVRPAALRALWELHRQPPSAQALLFRHEERLQPLCGWYHRQACEVLERAFEEGERSLLQALHRLDVQSMAANANFEWWHPELLTNVNTPADWEHFLKGQEAAGRATQPGDDQ